MKSRGVYETPGGSLLYAAHSELEQLVLDRRTLAAKDLIAPRYADLVYEGRWWTTEREAYDAFVAVTQERVTGSVTLRLYKGSTAVVGRESEHALYDERFVTFGEDDVYQQSDAAGFIRLFALPARVRALKDQELGRRPLRRRPSRRRPSRRCRSRDGDVACWRVRRRAQALGRALRGGRRRGVRRAQFVHRRRLPTVAARRAAVQGVGGRALSRRRPLARRKQRDRARTRSRRRRDCRAGNRRRRPTRTCTR